jgi:acyl carrier protein
MVNLEGFEDALLLYISTEVNPSATGLHAQTDLLAGEILDSLGILAIIGFVENRYGLEIEAEEVSLDSFRTVSAIRQLVAEKLSV